MFRLQSVGATARSGLAWGDGRQELLGPATLFVPIAREPHSRGTSAPAWFPDSGRAPTTPHGTQADERGSAASCMAGGAGHVDAASDRAWPVVCAVVYLAPPRHRKGPQTSASAGQRPYRSS